VCLGGRNTHRQPSEHPEDERRGKTPKPPPPGKVAQVQGMRKSITRSGLRHKEKIGELSGSRKGTENMDGKKGLNKPLQSKPMKKTKRRQSGQKSMDDGPGDIAKGGAPFKTHPWNETRKTRGKPKSGNLFLWRGKESGVQMQKRNYLYINNSNTKLQQGGGKGRKKTS